MAKAHKNSKPTKLKKGTPKTVVERIKEVVVTPNTKSPPTLVTPLPQKELKLFGELPFAAQAAAVFQTFPADVAEIIGTTENSGAGSVTAPPIAGK